VEEVRVLLVDDEREISQLIQIVLQKEGFSHVALAEDGREALRLIDEFQPHIIVLDVMLPDANGYDLCRTIRERTEAPILFLTARSSVKGYADLPAEEQYDWEPAEIRRYAGVIRDKAHYMEQLIADLNLTFRLKNEALPLQLAEHDLVEVVRQTVIDVMNDPCSEAYALSFQPFVDRVMVRLDKEWFQRALHNLLANAVTHNPPGTEVKVSVQSETDRMVIVVEDDGQGMDQETQGMLFERYYRGTNTAKHSQGTGLGMAIAKQLIEAHGGEIHISSQVGRGTKISVCLPKLTALRGGDG
jgi:signal transduction histidine kinase